MTREEQARCRSYAIVSFVMAFIIAVSSLISPQTAVSYAKYASSKDAGTINLSITHAHAILTTGLKLNRALATGTTTSGAASKYSEIADNTALTEVYFGTPDEYASQISGITGVDVSQYGDGSIMLYKNGTKAYIVSERSIAANEDFSCAFTKFTKLSKVHFSSDFDTSRTKSFAYFFYNCQSLATVENLATFDTSNATSLQSMFYLNTAGGTNTALKSLDVSGFNTAKVTDMGSIFRTCAGLTSIDVSGFNTSQVTDMGGMFDHCTGLTSLDLTGFDTSKVTTMELMFGNMTIKTLDLRSFSCESLTKMNSMFINNSKLTTIYADYDFDCRAISDPAATDETDANGNYEIDSAFGNIFAGCTSLVGGSGTKYDEDIVHNLRAVVDVKLAVEQTVFQSTVGYFTHYSVANPGSAYMKNGQDFNAAIKTLATGSSKAYSYTDTAIKKIVFGKTGSYNVSGLQSVNVDSANSGSIKAYWNASTGTVYVLSDSTICLSSSSDYMFAYMDNLTGISFDNISTSAARTMQHMFAYCPKLSDVDLSKFETQNIVDYGSCFRNAAISTETANNKIIPYLNTSKARDIGGLFINCTNLTGALDMSNLSSAKAETIASIVQGCTGLTSVDISGFTTGTITNIENMFAGCTNLQKIYTAPNFNLNIEQVEKHSSVFSGCTALVGGNGTKFNASYITKTYARPDASGTPGYFTSVATFSIMSTFSLTAAPSDLSASDLDSGISTTEPEDVSASDITSVSTTATTAETTTSATSATSTVAATEPTSTGDATAVTSTSDLTSSTTSAAETTAPTEVTSTSAQTQTTTSHNASSTTATTTLSESTTTGSAQETTSATAAQTTSATTTATTTTTEAAATTTTTTTRTTTTTTHATTSASVTE